MTTDAVLVLGLIGVIFVALATLPIAPDMILMAGVIVLMVGDLLSPTDALAGLSNEGMVTIAFLFVVGAGVRETGAIDWIASRLFGRPETERGAIARLMAPTAVMSAFMNNTPLVAVLIPAVADWAKKRRIAVSKLMIPLSYAAILGGTCTLIGTSTNLVVNGLLINEQGVGLNMFDITWVGLPAAAVGIAFIVAFSSWLLPDRRPVLSRLDDPREYTVEMLVPWDSPLVNQTIEQAGLRHLPGVYLAEIDRAGDVLPAVSPEERLRADDRLVFVGVVESVVDLQKMRGLIPATDQVFKLNAPRATRCLTEAVVSDTCPVVGMTIRDGRFRSRYSAVVLAVARNGERLRQKIGDIVLQPGDTLLLESHPSFVEQQRNSRDFFLVSRLEDSTPPRHDRAPIALAILLGLVVAMAANWATPLKGSAVAAMLMLLTRSVTVSAARRSIDLSTLLAIAAAFGLGKALETSGAAISIADRFVGMAGGNAWGSLAIVYIITLIVTKLITNNAAAVLMFPFAMATADKLDVNHMPFVIALMMAASAGFATPIGYQTNLMVYGPGGYKFSDYCRVGVPLDILIALVTIALAPLVWGFAK